MLRSFNRSVITGLKQGKRYVSSIDYITHRINVWDRISKAKESSSPRSGRPIKVILPDSKVIEGVAGVTTPMAIAASISPSLAKQVLVATVKDNSSDKGAVLYDLQKPLGGDVSLKLHKFDSKEGKQAFWHSSAHILGSALESYYGDIFLDDGPALPEGHPNGGFFYDFRPGSKGVVSSKHFEDINQLALRIVNEKLDFKRLEVTRAEASELFKYNPLKMHLLERIPSENLLTIYRCGNFIDLCAGPHIPNTGLVRGFSVVSNSPAHWFNESDQGLPPSLQRVYGMSFPDPKQLQEWKFYREEAEKRDHRAVGATQKLFMFSQYSPGSAFFLPHGTRIYNRLMQYLRSKYHEEGYEEVITPLMFRNDLWKKSGHWAHYKTDMFSLDQSCLHHQHSSPKTMVSGGESNLPTEPESEGMSLKPMNCPGHCLIFQSMNPSYRDLPIRLADFSALHRNEDTGALRGLTRVRRFSQDDAHIFCRPDQIHTEVGRCLSFLKDIYSTLGFEYRVVLSTRPASFMGNIDTWNSAEESLESTLKDLSMPYSINAGDGAFYGPKIDVLLQDAINREHQCGTIQLDFQLPDRFKLSYQDSDDIPKRPIIVHRAILGSLERMMGILVEHTAGKWPFWLSPRQAIILNVNQESEPFAKEVHKKLHGSGYFVDLNLEAETIPKKVKLAQDSQYNFILVIGSKEVAEGKVNVRTRDGVIHGMKTVDEILREFASEAVPSPSSNTKPTSKL